MNDMDIGYARPGTSTLYVIPWYNVQLYYSWTYISLIIALLTMSLCTRTPYHL